MASAATLSADYGICCDFVKGIAQARDFVKGIAQARDFVKGIAQAQRRSGRGRSTRMSRPPGSWAKWRISASGSSGVPT
jgi:hypothetical protein